RASVVLLALLLTGVCHGLHTSSVAPAAAPLSSPPLTPAPTRRPRRPGMVPLPTTHAHSSKVAASSSRVLALPCTVIPVPGRVRPTIIAAPTPTPTPPPPVVFFDPGHGGVDTGTIGTALDGAVVMEKIITLALALRTAAKLRASGYQVVL